MATKVYLSTAAPAVTPPAPTADWGHVNTGVLGTLLTAADASALSTVAYSPDASSDHIADVNSLHRQLVSASLVAQTIATGQAITAQIQCLEAHVSDNLQVTIKILVCSQDGATTRGTLMTITRNGTEPTTSLLNRTYSATTTGNVVCSAGDRLVIEIGLGGLPTSGAGSNNHNGSIRVGCDASSGDLPVDDTQSGTTYRGWINFANTITFATATTCTATAIASGVAFGTPQATSASGTTCTATAISSGVAFGTAKALIQTIAVATALASTLAFGTASAQWVTPATATAISSGVTFGTPQAISLGPITCTATAIGSTVTFGTASAQWVTPATATAIGSGVAFGTPAVLIGTLSTATALSSTVTFGTPSSQWVTPAIATAIASGIAFGTSAASEAGTGPPEGGYTFVVAVRPRAFSPLIRRALFAAPPAAYLWEVLADAPVSYWRLGESAGPTAADVRGVNAGTYSGAVTFSQAGAIAGDADTAVNVDAGPYMTAGSTDIPIGAAARTVEFWVKSTYTGRQGLVGYGGAAAGRSFIVEAGLGGPGVIYFVGFSADVQGTVNIADGTYKHVVATYDGTTVRLYVNGAFDVEAARALNTSNLGTYPVTIGRQAYPDGANYQVARATIDEVAIYPTALSLARILAHYNAGSLGSYTPALASPFRGFTVVAPRRRTFVVPGRTV